jgi:hypothetical protein
MTAMDDLHREAVGCAQRQRSGVIVPERAKRALRKTPAGRFRRHPASDAGDFVAELSLVEWGYASLDILEMDKRVAPRSIMDGNLPHEGER